MDFIPFFTIYVSFYHEGIHYCTAHKYNTETVIKRHCTRFTGAHRYACSHSCPHAYVLQLLVFELCQLLQILVSFVHSEWLSSCTLLRRVKANYSD